ncbi:hypothetical protein C8J56DRAFT_1050515 [Mycena floridula]|nr:hypothetical protein C8J56DRAFT_1050515 [Mycena floridula]
MPRNVKEAAKAGPARYPHSGDDIDDIVDEKVIMNLASEVPLVTHLLEAFQDGENVYFVMLTKAVHDIGRFKGHDVAGRRRYLAPEVKNEEQRKTYCGYILVPADIWMFGLILDNFVCASASIDSTSASVNQGSLDVNQQVWDVEAAHLLQQVRVDLNDLGLSSATSRGGR